MGRKRKFKIPKARRKLSRAELFPKKLTIEEIELQFMNYCISQAIPNPEKRKEYIRSLIDGLENEPSKELK